MKRTILTLAALALLLGGVGQATAAPMIVNGSFETGDLTGWSGTATTDGFGYNPFGTTYGSGMDGTHWMWLSGYERERTLEQTVSGLTNGTTYAVNFIMASEFANSDSLNVSADGGTPVTFTAPPYNASGFNGGFWTVWVSKEFTFTANGTSATLQFSSFGLNSGGYDVGLDNVSIREAASAVPEPATLTMLGFGIAGLAGYGWRKRKQPVAGV